MNRCAICGSDTGDFSYVVWVTVSLLAINPLRRGETCEYTGGTSLVSRLGRICKGCRQTYVPSKRKKNRSDSAPQSRVAKRNATR